MTEHTVKLLGVDEEVTVAENQTILNACIQHGVAQEYSCRVGMCLACIARLVEGEVEQPGARGLSPADRERYVLTCMARPKSDLVIDPGVYPPSIDQEAVADGCGLCHESD
ncbi:MAG: 2Fe-2S iron-sulfur cluster-binding protein [Halobacteriota archaeon]